MDYLFQRFGCCSGATARRGGGDYEDQEEYSSERMDLREAGRDDKISRSSLGGIFLSA